MCLKILLTLFLITASILFFVMTFQKIFLQKLKNTGYSAITAALLILYVIISLLVALFLNNLMYGLIMFIVAMSPFIIGKLAKYETETFYSIMQITIIFLSIVFAMKMLV